MEPNFINRVADCATVYDIWQKLEEYFAKRSKSKKVTDSLSALGAPLSSEDFVDAVAHGLPEEYNPFIMMVSSRSDTITESEVEALLLG
ncbi:hypothetical protein PIB30_054956 [Stylosanthes scabra]|uniref:Uncharacterized protein n=1 Tax=Stylosanthes scabra TaxID=79078 RepID=A0ABU6RJF0_9FABA|nr:hypothetical protein [Stylosanthes scabra]